MNRSRTHKSRHDRAVMEVNREYPDDKRTRNGLAVGAAIALILSIAFVIAYHYWIVGWNGATTIIPITAGTAMEQDSVITWTIAECALEQE